LAPISHSITVADPKCSLSYLESQIRRLIGEGFQLQVGLSVVPIPLPFVCEHLGKSLPKVPEALVELLQSFFPMANIADIEDSLVDATFKRRNASSFVNHEYQLFFSQFWQAYKDYLGNYSGNNWRSEKHIGIEKFISPQRVALESNKYFSANFEFKDLPPEFSVDPQPKRGPLVFPKRLGFFDALRVDYSLSRIRHYTHTNPEDFQEHILLVNYPRYVRLFLVRVIAEICKNSDAGGGELVISSDNEKCRYKSADLLELFEADTVAYVVETFASSQPLDRDGKQYSKIDRLISERLIFSEGQMPTYHFIPAEDDGVYRRDENASDQAYRARLLDSGPLPGITLVNINVGSSNAWNITDHLAVLRPLCWVMVGHCAGLRSRQKVGDYVIANGYVRRDGALEESVPIDAPIQPTRVINVALQNALFHRIVMSRIELSNSGIVQEPLTGRDGWAPKRTSGLTKEQDTELDHQLRQQEALRGLLRSGTVMSVTNRNWETSPTEEIFQIFEQYRVVAVDMESAVIAANAYRYRVAHATFLCVTDKPVHGVLKAARSANDFYKSQTNEHLNIVLDAIKLLKLDPSDALDLLHARELRGIDDPPFR
jgi:AMP nucleosidase